MNKGIYTVIHKKDRDLVPLIIHNRLFKKVANPDKISQVNDKFAEFMWLPIDDEDDNIPMLGFELTTESDNSYVDIYCATSLKSQIDYDSWSFNYSKRVEPQEFIDELKHLDKIFI